ncbi:uncharacterized protein METZ01_LOCUS113590 [marine metagenome]|uniref:Uncharacterized protein n=1 Tax=marine metagenome TaxID=408172 RepID=A0A381X7K2_9ZZZZ
MCLKTGANRVQSLVAVKATMGLAAK